LPFEASFVTDAATDATVTTIANGNRGKQYRITEQKYNTVLNRFLLIPCQSNLKQILSTTFKIQSKIEFA
jgi:hypothetical protein